MSLKTMMFRLLLLLSVGIPACIAAGSVPQSRANESDIRPPHLDDAGLAGYREFLQSRDHRAFAIAPGGAWAWVSDFPDPDVAESEAIRACAGFTEQRCFVYSMDGQVVLDRAAWSGAWGPYMSAAAAATRPLGAARGARFPDLALTSPAGDPVRLSDLKGNIVLLHFWGSWCAPCQVEFPELQALYDGLKAEPGIAFVLVQAREGIDRSRRWAKMRGFAMPFYDSGVRQPSDSSFTMPDGGAIEDRAVAPRFPATYVLDSHGLVLFSHFGPVHSWREYEPLLRHAAENRPH